MITTLYQQLKIFIVHNIPVRPHDPYHIYIGFVCYILSGLIFNRKYSDPMSLIPVFIIAIAMEILDLHDDFISLGYCRWSASIHGLMVTNLLPIILLLLIKYKGSKFT